MVVCDVYILWSYALHGYMYSIMDLILTSRMRSIILIMHHDECLDCVHLMKHPVMNKNQ